MNKGFFLMIDGLDGSGKGTAIKSLVSYLEAKGMKAFSLHDYWKNSNNIPELEEVEGYDVIVSAEPTFSMVGKVIREEIVRNSHNRRYSALSTAHAFALDREILYKKLIIPALRHGKLVLQERGIVSSLVYQPVQLERLSLKDIAMLPGNRVALANAPDLLVITKVEPVVAIGRIKKRDKKDNAIFENLAFQQKIQLRYESGWLRKIFEKRGTKIAYLDTNPPKSVEDTKKDIIEIFKSATKKG